MPGAPAVLSTPALTTLPRSMSPAAIESADASPRALAWVVSRPRAARDGMRERATSFLDRIDALAREVMALPLRSLVNETSLYVASGEGRVVIVEGKSGHGKQLLQRLFIDAVQRIAFPSLLLCESQAEAVVSARSM
jgi:hypothetical protein